MLLGSALRNYVQKGAMRLTLYEAPTRPDHNTGNYVPYSSIDEAIQDAV